VKINDVEFLPERVREQRARRRRLTRQGYLLAACVACMSVLTYVNMVRIDRAKRALGELRDRGANIARQIQMISPVEQELAELMIKQRIEADLGSRTDCTAVLAELCHVLPQNMALVSLELRATNVAAGSGSGGHTTHQSARPVVASGHQGARSTVRRARLVITGLAPTDVDVANFIGQLSASCVFENVNMAYAKTVTFQDRTAREFQASCYLAR